MIRREHQPMNKPIAPKAIKAVVCRNVQAQINGRDPKGVLPGLP